MTYICHAEIGTTRENELECYCQWGGIKPALNIKCAHNNLN